MRAWNAVSAFVNCGRAVAHVRGGYVHMKGNQRASDQFFDTGERCTPTGIASSKMEPSESDLISLNLPPRFVTKVEEMASPNPIPPGFVVKNGSNIRSRSSAEIPGPESWTDINTVD
jgi:hypothetical protein